MIIVDIATRSKKWSGKEKFCERISKKIIPFTELGRLLKKNIIIEVAISLVLDRQMKKINFEFRGKNKPTNVLSFPALDENLIHEIGLEKAVGNTKHFFCGDIILSFEIIKKESIAQKKSFDDHLTHLILHSILHLIGFDHEDKKSAKIMENLEIKILKKFHINNPYI